MAYEGQEMGETAAAGARRGAPVAVLVGGLVAFGAAVAAYALMVLGHPHELWTMSDLKVYRWGGLLARHSDRLYDKTIGGFGFTYPPLAAAIFATLSAFSMPALRLLSALSGLVSLVLSVGIAWRMLGHRRVPMLLGATLALSAAALWTEPVQKTLWFGQINLVLMLIVLADLSQRDGRPWKGVGIGVATGIKLTPAIFVAYLLVTRRFRAAVVAVGTFLLTVAAGFAALPHESWQYWLDGLFASPGRVGPVGWVGNQSLYGLLVRLLGSEHAARPYWLAAAAAVAAAGLWLSARQSRRGDELPAVLTCAVTGLLISPISWSHHWVWIAPILVLAADRALRPARRAWPGTPWARAGARAPAATWVRAGTGVAALLALEALFGAWIFKVSHLPALPEGLIRSVPFGAHREQRWHGTELLVGNLYVLLALGALLALAVAAVRARLRVATPVPAGDGTEPAR